MQRDENEERPYRSQPWRPIEDHVALAGAAFIMAHPGHTKAVQVTREGLACVLV
jgi:hypothetical protein